MMIEYQTTVYEEENRIIRIHKPILTAEEREKRQEIVKKVLIEFEKSRRSVNNDNKN